MALTTDKLQLAEFKRQVFAIRTEEGEKLEDLLDSKYWNHVAAKFHPGDKIEVTAYDNSAYTELMVASCDKTWAKVAVLSSVTFGNKVKSEKKDEDRYQGADHFVDWGGNQQKGRVINKSSKAVVQEGFPSKDAAAEWMKTHEANLLE